ncbi:hypothetical protein BU23DRAFT_530337 [Bimuria novae-zelandiae CBS 107.79]|uniref:OPA3-domain-containing protein n=1 Tax=Bimuria novae-zelandiae CBS 107.79 TaxID=1447943 RepID=A0A6A5VDL4_9PLEO|nr:hypothetical protein BU23DRAFT_530337 [Bimuria novae-zelandiae CBS 107.79]
MSLTLKIGSLFIRTAAKPIANRIKQNAREHPQFKAYCVNFAQRLHRLDLRMRLGLLQDSAVIDRQVEKEVKAAAAARKKLDQIPTVKTEAEMQAEEAMSKEEKEAARKKVEEEERKKTEAAIRRRPLSESKAIEMGANFVAESFVFAVALSLLLFEQWRQRRKAKNQRDDIREDVEELREDFKSIREELAELKALRMDASSNSLLPRFLTGKSDAQKPLEKALTKAEEDEMRRNLRALRRELRAVGEELESIKERHKPTSLASHIPFWKESTNQPKNATAEAHKATVHQQAPSPTPSQSQ